MFGTSSADAELRVSAPEVVEWRVHPERGFVTLAMVYAPHVKVGSQSVADTPAAWADVWEFYGFRGRLPAIDFKRRRVVVFVEADPCAGGGHGGWPVVVVQQFRDGALLPRFAGPEPDSISCPDVLIRPRRRGHAYALALPRQATTAPLRVELDRPLPSLREEPNQSPCEECLTPADADTSGVPEPVADDGTVSLPAVGNTALVALGDGTPVWVVRHHDSSVSVLAADYEAWPEWLPGLRIAVRWDPRRRSFACCDEHGTALLGARPGLDQFAARVQGKRLWIGARGAPRPPGPVAALRVPRSGELDPWWGRRAFDGLPRRPLAAALESDQGSWSVVDGARLVVRAGQATRVCEAYPARGARQTCAAVAGFAVPEKCRGTFDGPLALRRTRSGFADAIFLSFSDYYWCEVSDGVRGISDPNFGWGFERLRLAANAAVLGGWAGSSPLLGGELTASLRYRWLGLDIRPRSFLEHQLGDTFELSLRVRRLQALSESDGATAWTVGLAPGISSRHVFQSLTHSTLLGVLIPELGFAMASDEAEAYLAWRFAVEYRLTPANRRQQPYSPSERLAFEVAPSFLLLSEGSPRYVAALSLGLTSW